MKDVEVVRDLVLDTLLKDYRDVLKVNLDTGYVEIVKTQNHFVKDKSYFWEEYIENVLFDICEDDHLFLKNLSMDQVIDFYHNKNTIFPFEIRRINEEQKYDWIKVNARVIDGEKKEVLITSQIDNENHMMQKIIDLYVLNNLDYFVLINVNDGSYKMFSGNPNSSLPPESGSDYEYNVLMYNESYVVPEEEKEVTANMMLDHVVRKLENHDMYEFTAGFFDPQGEYHRSRVQFSYYDRLEGTIVLTRTDITQIYLDEGEKERKLANAIREAKHDAMTNLYNNKASSELISNALVRQYRANAVLCFVDLDNFKLVNDTLGHQIGDQVICHVADKLQNLASKDGIAGRLGGDEFVLFLPVTNSMKIIEEYVQSICDSLLDCAVLKTHHLPVSCSVGIAQYPKDGTSYEELLLKSDQALYNAKRYGKNCYSFYSETLSKVNNPNHPI